MKNLLIDLEYDYSMLDTDMTLDEYIVSEMENITNG